MTISRRPRIGRAAEVQEAVKEIILARGLVAGDPLPTEFELMEELGAGRNSVREALKALQAVGIVEIRHGFGMFVGRLTLHGLVDELAFHSRMTLADGCDELGHLMEVREMLESGLVQRLVEERSDLTPAAEIVEQMAGGVSVETDRRFHEVLYRPLGNPLVIRLLSAFWDVYEQLRDQLGDADESPEDVVRRHRDILDAVTARDSPRAAAAMRAHFDGVRARLDRLRASN
jgi:DNA-binding FadR family transcriptional regulator